MALAYATQHPDLEMNFAERLAFCRERAGLKQADLAEELGVSRPLISKWENGKTEPTATQAARWAERTGVPVEWLVRSRCFLSIDGAAEPTLFDPDTGLGWRHRGELASIS